MVKHSTDLKQVSGLLKQVITKYDGAQVIADYGAGTGDKALKLATEYNKILYRYDPYLPDDVNQEFWKHVHEDVVDVVTSSNVLNVIMDDDDLHKAMLDIVRASANAKIGAIVTVYQAPLESATQRAKHLTWYAEKFREITTRLVDVHHGKLFIYPKED